MSSEFKKTIKKTALYLGLSLLSLIILVPLYLIVINSLKNKTEAAVIDLSIPSKFLFNNYTYVLVEGRIIRAFCSSLIITVASVAVVLLFTSMAAFIIDRRKTFFTNAMYYYLIAGLIAPLSIIPELKLMHAFGFTSNLSAIILVQIAVNIPFAFFLFSGFIRTVDRELDESAFIDGCYPLRTYFQIILPLLKPVMFTALILIFMNVWNDFQYSLYFIPRSSMYTMPLTVYSFMGFHTADMNLVCADMIFATFPVIIVYIVAQKYIVAGITAGAVKG